MTEAEWLGCTDPQRMLDFLASEREVTNRKARLLTCGCSREIWAALPGDGSRQWVEVSERYADREASLEQLTAAHQDVGALTKEAIATADSAWLASGPQQAGLIRDIVGNPFRPPAVKPEWAESITGGPRGLAETIYRDRAFDRMKELADALEQAGCSDETILAHCRQSAAHVRGCWVLDLILGKS